MPTYEQIWDLFEPYFKRMAHEKKKPYVKPECIPWPQLKLWFIHDQKQEIDNWFVAYLDGADNTNHRVKV